MKSSLFDRFRSIAYQQAGIRLSDGKRTLVAARVGRRLRALGIPEHAALGAVRLSLGFATTAQDVEAAADALITAWRQCRAPHRARA